MKICYAIVLALVCLGNAYAANRGSAGTTVKSQHRQAGCTEAHDIQTTHGQSHQFVQARPQRLAVVVADKIV